WTLATGEFKQLSNSAVANGQTTWRNIGGGTTSPTPNPNCHPGPPRTAAAIPKEVNPKLAIAYDRQSLQALSRLEPSATLSQVSGNETLNDRGGPVLCGAEVFLIF